MATFVLPLVILFLALSLQVVCGATKEGFLTYVVYGPDSLFARRRRPYWGSTVAPDQRRGWRRRYWYGPCPGPWCPYA
jgi:hypothetical protein